MAITKQDSVITGWEEIRDRILERDNHQCTCCGRPESIVEALHVDHSVPQGRGGSDRFENLRALCEQCHFAKHGEGLAPMVQLRSPQTMDEYTFRYYEHFFKQMLPSLGRQVGVRVNPKFKLDDKTKAWFISLGTFPHLDATLATFDEEYLSFQAAEYM